MFWRDYSVRMDLQRDSPLQFVSVRAGWRWKDLAGVIGVAVGAAEDRDAVEGVLLKPFQPEINHGRDEECD